MSAKAAAENCRHAAPTRPSMPVTRISESARVTRWRSVSDDAMSFFHIAGSKPAVPFLNVSAL
jgi:hypothetical protein